MRNVDIFSSSPSLIRFSLEIMRIFLVLALSITADAPWTHVPHVSISIIVDFYSSSPCDRVRCGHEATGRSIPSRKREAIK